MNGSFKSALCGLILAGAVTLPGNLVFAQDHAPDNTAVNRQAQPTADQAHNNMSDRQMMSHIRREVVADKSLSTYGHNVKIIAKNGKVTLRGPVHSDDEKRAIEEHARKYAGDGNVDNQLTVKGDQK